MNKVLIVDNSESDRRLISGLLSKSAYEPIAVYGFEDAKSEVMKLSTGAVIVTAMKFRGGNALRSDRMALRLDVPHGSGKTSRTLNGYQCPGNTVSNRKQRLSR